ncbi:MAG: hypothetical protein ACHQK9_09435 [Reyranellales bacterium]
MATSTISFYHAIYKRLWAFASSYSAHDGINNYDTFSLESPDAPTGIFGMGLGPQPMGSPYVQGQQILKIGDYNANNNPLWVMLNTSLTSDQSPNAATTVTVNNQTWPIMPPTAAGFINNYPDWFGMNDMAKPPTLVDGLKHWIEVDQQPDDTIKGSDIVNALQAKPNAFPFKPKDSSQILFVASMPGDDGRRPGDGDTNDPGPNYVPAHYWDSSLIFVTDTLGNDEHLPPFEPGTEHYIAAIIGNSGNMSAGTIGYKQPTTTAICYAYVFTTFFSPKVALPSLDNLDSQGANTVYEQLRLRAYTYDVVGFRFTVDTVYQELTTAMQMANYSKAKLGNLTIDEWLKKGHACVKVLITAGEVANAYTPQGAVPDEKTSLPSLDRHIAQRNLAKFEMTLMGAAKQLGWQKFVVEQAGAGLNGLSIQHGLPGYGLGFYVAVAAEPYAQFVAKGGSHRGFEVVREVPHKPFPDAVILRQTTPGATLHIADHTRDGFGMALGIEWEPARLKGARLGDVAMVHRDHGGRIVGGFTLRLTPLA